MSVIISFRGPYRFLSNPFPCKVVYEGMEYPSSEHAFIAAKNLDPEWRKMIQSKDWRAAKYLGRKVQLRPMWDEIKVSVMEDILRSKFSDEKLRGLLISTYPDKLIEGNNWGDRFWGMTIEDGRYGGCNHLGRLLMKLRKEFMEE